MTQITVEKALQWAYGQELPKLNSPRAAATIPSNWQLTANAVNGLYSSGSAWTSVTLDPSRDEPHPDAVVLHQAVCALRDLKFSYHRSSAGCLLDGIAGFGIDPLQAINDAWAKIGIDVIRHAKLCSRPEVAEPPRPRPMSYLNGAIRVLKPSTVRQRRTGITYATETPVTPNRRGQYDRGSYCPLRWSPDPKTVLRDRAEYVAWVAALELIVINVIAVSSEMSSRITRSDDIEMTPWCAVNSRRARPKTRLIHSISSDLALQRSNTEKAAQYLYLRGVARL